MSQLYRINPARLHQFVQAIWLHAGSEADEARLVADHLVAANLAGHDSHGVGMIPSYMRSFTQGHLQLNQHPVLEKDAGAVLTFHARAGFGQVAAYESMQQGIERARQSGIAAVGLHHSHHIGRIGHWAEQCAAAGFISFHFVNVMGDPMVAPFGGSDRRRAAMSRFRCRANGKRRTALRASAMVFRWTRPAGSKFVWRQSRQECLKRSWHRFAR